MLCAADVLELRLDQHFPGFSFSVTEVSPEEGRKFPRSCYHDIHCLNGICNQAEWNLPVHFFDVQTTDVMVLVDIMHLQFLQLISSPSDVHTEADQLHLFYHLLVLQVAKAL